MKRVQSIPNIRIWPLLLAFVLAAALSITWPWWYTWVLWRHKTTSWIQSGEGVDPVTYIITNATASGPQRIPKIIHQTWKDANIPVEWQAAQSACKALHPDFEYKLWTDVSSREFIASYFPELLKTWDSYPFNIQRADAIRYAVLQKYGGYYIDLDIECVRPLHFLGRYPVVMPQTQPVGFSNDFLAAEPEHPFMHSIVSSLPRWNMNMWLKYPTVMFSTGPMLVTLKASFFTDRKALWVLPDDMYNKYVKGKRPLFQHLYGSSWHGDDAKSVLWILHHPLFLAILTLTVALGAGVLCWRRFMRYRQMRRANTKAFDTSGSIAYAPLTEITTVKRS